MKTHTKHLIIILLLCTYNQAQAEARYITDQFKVMMRSGEGITHKILKALPSGTHLSVLKNNRETGYSKVRTKNGDIGYVLSRQLMKKPSARARLATIEAQLKTAEEEPRRLRNELASAQSKLKKLSANFSQLQQIKNKTGHELETIRRTAADAIQMAKERVELRKNVANLTRQIADLKQENSDLRNQNSSNWFLTGAAVIIAGILIGLILPRLHVQRRKDTWGSL